MTATDSQGLAASQVVEVRPETIPLRLASVPAGAPLSYAGYEVVAPRDLTSAIGFHTTVTAADRFQRAGETWLFDRWSDGGARVHNISIPGVRTGLTA